MDFQTHNYQVSLFHNIPLSYSGKWGIEYGVGVQKQNLESNQAERGKLFVYSGSGFFTNFSGGVRYLLVKSGFFPFMELGVQANLRVTEKVKLAKFTPINSNYWIYSKGAHTFVHSLSSKIF